MLSKKTKRALKRCSAGGSIGPAPKSHKLVGEFRDPSERAGGIPFLIPYGARPENIDRAVGSRRRRDPNEPMPGNWYGPVTASRADGGSVIDDLRESWEMAAADQTGGKGAQTVEEIAGMLPVTGNALAARDAYTSGRDALEAARAGEWKRAGVDAAVAGVSALGALSPLPWGRTAGRVAKAGRDTVNVLVPASEDGGTAVARRMRSQDESPTKIWRQTRRAFAPDGSVRREIPDTGIELKRTVKAGDVLPLSHYIRHPRLFAAFPQLAGRPVYVTNDVDRIGAPVMRTLEGNAGYAINPAANVRTKIAKLLQYDVNAESGFAKPLRHGQAAFENALDSAATRADMLDPGNRAAVDAYLDQLAEVRDNYNMRRQAEQYGAGRGRSEAAAYWADRNAGNMDAKAAEVRAGVHPDELSIWPYARHQGGSKSGLNRFEDAFVLPPDGMEGEDLLKFIEQWGQYGAGRGRFARGGRVRRALKRHKVITGAVRGATGGRSDELPVSVPAGSYVIPADVVAALGEGNSEAGMAQLEKAFPVPRARRADGGAVPILISDGEFVVSPEAVEMAGGADALDGFVLRVRKAFTEHLKGLPAPQQ